MRGPRGIVLAAAALLVGAALVACFDLLHSTADILTACEIDASRPGCGPAATAEAVDTNFCAWTRDDVRQHALHACAWLGACETPMGNNAFGPCYFRALMAYDCAANPNHRVHNAAHRVWDCLQRVRTCGDVDACIFRNTGAPPCQGQGVDTACASTTDTQDVRVRCADGGAKPYPKARGENCALWGETCAAGNGGSVCAGGPGGVSCAARECVGTSLHWCAAGADAAPGSDLGLDCASNGAVECGGFPSPDAALWLACKAESDAAAGAADCTPDASATCENGRAVSCPSGVVETLDCERLLGGGADSCTEGPLTPPFDWTSPCALPRAACTSDSCDGTTVMSCERGANFFVSCESEGLRPCRLLATDPGVAPRAACTPPAP